MSSYSSPQSIAADRITATTPHLLAPNPMSPDATMGEIDLESHQWMVATIIEDDDLMFGGKPLSAWYEEDRRESMGYEDMERRGRQRERPRSENSHHHHHHHHHHHKQGKSKKEGKQ